MNAIWTEIFKSISYFKYETLVTNTLCYKTNVHYNMENKSLHLLKQIWDCDDAELSIFRHKDRI